MKIAWVTPFTLQSSTGRFSAAVTNLLEQRGHQITVIRSEYDRYRPTPACPSSFPIKWWHDCPPAELESANDVVVINVANNYDHHAGILTYLNAIPCLGIFHNCCLFDFFREWIGAEAHGQEIYESEIFRISGAADVPFAALVGCRATSADHVAKTIPMFDWVASGCGAALAHADIYANRLARACAGPIAVTPPCSFTNRVAPLSKRSAAHVVLTTFSVRNGDPDAQTILAAIAASPMLSRRCHYRLVGPIECAERLRLTTSAEALGFAHFEIVGEVNEANLSAEFDRADIVSCFGGAECSILPALEGMKSGRPTIVPDSGAFAALPDGLVFKLSPRPDVVTLTQLLERLVSDEVLRCDTGVRAAAWATRQCSPHIYVDVVENLMHQLIEVKPLLAFGARFGRELRTLGVPGDAGAVERLADVMRGLFGADTTDPVAARRL